MRVAPLACGLATIAVISVAAQSPPRPAPAAKPTTGKAVPRASDGRPDLQGIWDFAQLTPFERPGEFAGKDALTDEEAETYAAQRVESSNKDRRDGPATADVERAYNDFWWDFGTRVAKQPSLVVDPPDGRVPDTTPEAKARAAAARGKVREPRRAPARGAVHSGFQLRAADGAERLQQQRADRADRDRVLILNEMIHSARVVDLTRRQHHPASLRFLTGDSIGRWEGDTLVVDTTNFQKEGAFRGASTNLHLVERFTRVNGDQLRYDFTVDDPATWTRKWSASIPMVRTDEQMFEYACHEANYALEGVLKGARYQEKEGGTK